MLFVLVNTKGDSCPIPAGDHFFASQPAPWQAFGTRGMSNTTRRSFLCQSAAAVASISCVRAALAQASKSPFKIAVISDEISPDFDHACQVVAQEFGLSWIELRSMWGKSLMDLSEDQIGEVQKILAKYGLRVTDIASPLFKTDWPGAPRSQHAPRATCTPRRRRPSSSRTRCWKSPSRWPRLSRRTRCDASISGASTM